MRIGALRDRITLRQETTEQDEIGQPIPTWSDVATIWADFRFLNGKEFITADKEVSEATASVRIRHRVVTPDMRVYYKSPIDDGKEYEIIAVLPARNHIDLAVKEWQGE